MRRAIGVDFPLVGLALLLSIMGVAAVYSAGQTDVSTGLANLWRTQSLYLALGLGAAWMVSRISVRAMDHFTPPIYIGTLLALVLLLFVGRGAGTGALLGHGRIEAGPVDLDAGVARQLLGQLDREAVRVVQRERHVAR
jgi:cell division protein FtsW (lipid II flippase)